MKRSFGLLLVFALLAPCASRSQEGQVATRADRIGGSTVTQGSSALKARQEVDVLREPFVPGLRALGAAAKVRSEAPRELRGSRSVQLYERVSPSVVLVATEDGLGSGTLLSSQGDILTNWHVVAGAKAVAVVFKPPQEGQKITKADLRVASVLRVDQVADLALLRVSSIPPGVEPVPLGDESTIAVGADVHAIGHPTGEVWTYTMGVISQVRQDYDWVTESKLQHHATVIQTQTPINPGNSGGPLLNDEGALIGVNSFKEKGESLNFAVALSEVRRFLSQRSDRYAAKAESENAAPSQSCAPKELYSGKRVKEGYDVIGVDLDCDGKADMEFRLPFDEKEPLQAAFDRNKDGRIDLLVFSVSRNANKWDYSFVDVDFDGEWDLVGYHETGEIVATRYEPYQEFVARVKKSRPQRTSKRP